MPKDEFGLFPKQRAFADYFIECGNATEAARKAGYKDAKTSGCKNTALYAVKQYIDARMKPTEEKRVADADEVLRYLSAVMRGEVKDQFGLEASLQERTNAAKELLKRYAVADQRQQGTMAKLDAILLEFTTAIQAPASGPVSAPIDVTEAPIEAPIEATEGG